MVMVTVLWWGSAPSDAAKDDNEGREIKETTHP